MCCRRKSTNLRHGAFIGMNSATFWQ